MLQHWRRRKVGVLIPVSEVRKAKRARMTGIMQATCEDREHVRGEVLQSWVLQSKESEMAGAGVVVSWVHAIVHEAH